MSLRARGRGLTGSRNGSRAERGLLTRWRNCSARSSTASRSAASTRCSRSDSCSRTRRRASSTSRSARRRSRPARSTTTLHVHHGWPILARVRVRGVDRRAAHRARPRPVPVPVSAHRVADGAAGHRARPARRDPADRVAQVRRDRRSNPTGIVPGGDVVYHLFGAVARTATSCRSSSSPRCVAVGLSLLFRYTALGLRMRAVVESPRMAELAGTDSDRVSMRVVDALEPRRRARRRAARRPSRSRSATSTTRRCRPPRSRPWCSVRSRASRSRSAARSASAWCRSSSTATCRRTACSRATCARRCRSSCCSWC